MHPITATWILSAERPRREHHHRRMGVMASASACSTKSPRV